MGADGAVVLLFCGAADSGDAGVDAECGCAGDGGADGVGVGEC